MHFIHIPANSNLVAMEPDSTWEIPSPLEATISCPELQLASEQDPAIFRLCSYISSAAVMHRGSTLFPGVFVLGIM